MKLTSAKIAMALFLLVLIQGSLFAQEKKSETLSLSLKQAQEYAIANSTASKNADIDLQLAKKKIWETTAIGLPQLSAQGNYQHLFKKQEFNFPVSILSDKYVPMNNGVGTGSSFVLPSGDSINLNFIDNKMDLAPLDNITLDITLSQLVFSGEYLVGLQASKVFYMMSDQSRMKTEIDLKESVANTYGLVLMLGQSKGTLASSLENLNKTLSEMHEMFNQGFIESTDVDQIELTSLTLTNSLSSINRQEKSALDLLKFQIGLPFETELILTENLEQIAAIASIDALQAKQFDIGSNIDFQMMQTQEKLGVLSLKREKSGYLPNLAAVYRHTEKVNKPAFDFTPADVFLLTLNIPIFSSGQRNVKVQQRKLELQKTVNTNENAANGLRLQYNTSLNDLTTAYENYLNNQKNIELTSRIYEKTLIKYKEGLSSSLDLTTVQNQYLKAQSDYYSAVYSLITAKNKLDKLNNNL